MTKSRTDPFFGALRSQMSAHAYTEDQFVEQPAKSQTALACLCWVIAEDPGHGMWAIARLASGDANQR